VRAVGAGIALTATVAAVMAACNSASGQPAALPVPTFAAAADPAPRDTATAPTDEGQLPDDCTRVLAGNDLGALFGLPVDSVTVRTIIGQPAPAVGRTERLACQYRRTGDAQGDLLDLNIGAYTDADAAARHWKTNADAEDGARRDVQLGDARGVLVERPSDVVLMIANDADTLTFVLPRRIRIRDLSSADTLTDLALRVLPSVSGAADAD
jgi:hypothetical protein